MSDRSVQASTGTRRVVTGVSPEGKSVIVSDERVTPVTVALMPGSSFDLLWGSDEIPQLPLDGTEPPHQGYFPPPGGYRTTLYTLAPQASAVVDGPAASALEEMQEKLPGIVESMEPENPGMHTSETIECTYVVSGEIWCELDDGAEFVLRPGDVNVMNGTRHAWTNKSSEPVTLMTFSVGARPAT